VSTADRSRSKMGKKIKIGIFLSRGEAASCLVGGPYAIKKEEADKLLHVVLRKNASCPNYFCAFHIETYPCQAQL
jgi:hypothetical protein